MFLFLSTRSVVAFSNPAATATRILVRSSSPAARPFMKHRHFSTTADESSTSATEKANNDDTADDVRAAFTLPVPLPVNYSMEEIVSLCKRRGIIFPSSEIYNGYAGFYDYGPLGAELKKNVKDVWWRTFCTSREDVVGLDSSIVHNPATWKSSGMYEYSEQQVLCTA
jgi:hypothetical protein